MTQLKTPLWYDLLLRLKDSDVEVVPVDSSKLPAIQTTSQLNYELDM